MKKLEESYDHQQIVTEVTKDNVGTMSSLIFSSLEKTSFLSFDLELSGLGDRSKLQPRNIEQRYSHIVELAKTRSILSFGISFFQNNSDSNDCKVETYNILLLCQDSYVVDPDSMKFLTQNGFDFSKQITNGLPYYPGKDRETQEFPFIRKLLIEIWKLGPRVIIHNGFIDLIFLYQGFFSVLPDSFQVFLADIESLFRGGIFDTKYISDFCIRDSSSFLEYLFWKRFYQNHQMLVDTKNNCKIQFVIGRQPYQEIAMEKISDFDIFNKKQVRMKVCETYKNHGHCKLELNCPYPHNIKHIFNPKNNIKFEHIKKQNPENSLKRKNTSRRKKKKMLLENEKINYSNDEEPGQICNESKTTSELVSGGEKENEPCQPSTSSNSAKHTGMNRYSHRAGFDAFMTGFVYFIDRFTLGDRINELKNHIPLSHNQVPLKIVKSIFASNSTQYIEKYKHFFSELKIVNANDNP